MFVNPSLLLDACVLYPAPVRDLLLYIADADLFEPKWSAQIHEEWVRNLSKNRTDLTIDSLKKTVNAMNRAFPEANVSNFAKLIPTLNLPDPDDRHVLAAAIQAGADQIVTFNLKDFPAEILKRYNITATHPDSLIAKIATEFPNEVFAAFSRQVEHLKNPPFTMDQVLHSLVKCGLHESVKILRKMLPEA
jgi:predicted nucleic acid-binding protein